MLKRNENENEEQFLWRVGQAKDSGLISEGWSEIADVFNKEFREFGEERTESAYRKAYQQAKRFYDAGVFVNQSDDETRLRNLKEEISKERYKLSDQRIAYNKELREQARRESMSDVVRKVLEEYVPIRFEPVKYHECSNDCDLIIHLTDVHCGMNIDSSINTFNDEILSERLTKYIRQINEIRNTYNPQCAYVILGGDMIHGLIHTNARIESKENVVQQIMSVSDHVCVFLYSLAHMFERVEVHTTPGNHARSLPNKNEVPAKENFDLLIPFICDRAMANVDNVFFVDNTIDWTIASFEVRGHMVYATHGDKDNSRSVVSNMSKLARKSKMPLPDICYLGHRHTNGMTTVDDVKVIESGCIDGMDSFCFDNRIVGSPEQTVTLVTEDNAVKALFDIQL